MAGAALQAGTFHPIYAMAADTAEAALAGMDTSGLEAIVLLRTGKPTLRPILGLRGRAPAWRVSCAVMSGARAGAKSSATAAESPQAFA